MTRWPSAVAIAGLLALPACSDVMVSSPISLAFTSTGERQTCQSALGSYSLPMAMLRVKAQQGDGPATLIPFTDGGLVQVIRRPDPSLFFCLDYLNSPTTTDKIAVKKWPNPPPADNEKPPPSAFLGAVVVNSTDQSVFIINALLRSLFILITGDSDFLQRQTTTKAPVIVADLEFDPFSSRDSAGANERLHKLGYCLVLEDFTFDRHRFSVDQYCNAPESVGSQPSKKTKAYERASTEPADPMLPGLMYRARHPYRLAIYRKPDPGGRGSWALMQMTTVELENMSPVLSLDIRRAAFGARTANFVFNEGTLLTACVSKTSEILGAVQIPLSIAKSIVAVPASIIQIRIDQIKDQTQLVKVQSDLYQVQQAYLDALTSKQFKSPGGQTDFKAPALKLNLGRPVDLALRGSAPVYGNDLFGVELQKICEGPAAS